MGSCLNRTLRNARRTLKRKQRVCEQAGHRLRAVCLFSWSVEQNVRDTQMTTRLTKDARLERQPPSFLASRGFVARHSRSRSLPSVNPKKKRDCSQSRLDREQCPNFEGLFIIITKVIKSHVKLHVKFNATKISVHFSQQDREFFCLRVRSSQVT